MIIINKFTEGCTPLKLNIPTKLKTREHIKPLINTYAIGDKLIDLCKYSLQSNLTPMQKTIMLNTVLMLGTTLCFEVDRLLNGVDNKLKGVINESNTFGE